MNLNRIFILLLCENYICLNYVELVHIIYQVYSILLLLCTFILLISTSLILTLQLKTLVYLLKSRRNRHLGTTSSLNLNVLSGDILALYNTPLKPGHAAAFSEDCDSTSAKVVIRGAGNQVNYLLDLVNLPYSPFSYILVTGYFILKLKATFLDWFMDLTT